MHQVVEAVLLVEAEVEAEEVVLHNLLEEEGTLLNNNQRWQHMHPLMEHWKDLCPSSLWEKEAEWTCSCRHLTTSEMQTIRMK
jgi:hypothetical protein